MPGNVFENRRGQLDRIDKMTVKPMRVTGFVQTQGTGESSLLVAFPVWFIERPGASFSWELEAGQTALAGQFPTVNVGILGWITELRNDGQTLYYKGATLAIVSTGPAAQLITIHWHMEGKALRNPVGGIVSDGGLGGVI